MSSFSNSLTAILTGVFGRQLAYSQLMLPQNAYRENYCRSMDGTEIFFNVMGEGETVIFCDGIGCDQYAWTYLAPFLAQRFRVVRWNYRGHGRSGPPPSLAAMTMQRLCEDLDAVVDSVGCKKAVLVGHSMGVQVVLEQWHRRPQLVRALIPICGAYGRPLDTLRGSELSMTLFPYLRRLLALYPVLTQTVWENVVPTRLALAAAGLVEVNMDLVRVGDFIPYLDHLGHIDVQVFLALLDDISRHSAAPYMSQVNCPTLILAAERDTFTPARLAERLHEAIPNSEYLLVPMASHTMPIEMPDLVNLRVEKFFGERVFCGASSHVA